MLVNVGLVSIIRYRSRFDEQDAFVIFDDVEVPRDRVFIDANLAVYNSVMKTTWWPNHLQQTMIRAQTKLEFAWAWRAAWPRRSTSIGQPQVQMLGEIAMFAEFARTAVFAAEQAAREYGNGMWACDARPLLTLRAALPTWFPRTNEIIRQLGSHNLLTTPARAAFADEKLRPLLEKILSGVSVDAGSAAGSSGWPGTSPPRRSAAATSSTSASTSARSAALCRGCRSAATARAPTGFSTGFSVRSWTPARTNCAPPRRRLPDPHNQLK